MEKYNWKSHYADRITKLNEREGYSKYFLRNESGTCEIEEWDIFPGVQLVFNRLEMKRCARVVPRNDNILQISYCMSGSFESDGDTERSFVIGMGDLTLGTAGRHESRGRFSKGMYHGYTLFIDMSVCETSNGDLLRDNNIDIYKVASLTGIRKQRFIIHSENAGNKIGDILRSDLKEEIKADSIRITVLELLKYLCALDCTDRGNRDVLVKKEHADIASLVQKRITRNLSEHVTIDQLQSELNVGSTILKTSFKNVYGISIYAYLKDSRLLYAKNLLEDSDMRVADIAACVGYSNPSKFSASYKKRFGIRPGKTKKK